MAHTHQLLKQIEARAREALDGSLDATAALDAITRLAREASAQNGEPTPHALTRAAPSSPDPRSDARVLENIIDNIPYVVFWKDVHSVYLGCNAALARIAGLASTDEIVGRDDFTMPWTREEAEFFRSVDRRVMESGRPELSIEETQVQADGRQRVLLTSKVPLRDESNAIVGVLGIFTDITERKELEHELVRARHAAEASARAKSDFLAAMSHELRTPLTLILSPLESLLAERRDALPSTVVATLESVYRNARRLEILTGDVLDFSRHEAGHLELDARPLDVVSHVRQLVLDLAPTAAARGLQLTAARLDPTIGVAAVDVAKLDKILLNLLGNALKFTPAGGEIDVAVERLDDAMLLTVRDTGIGIDPADHARVFRRFEQVDGSSSRASSGVGLGLSLVKVLAELMGGSASVASELGRGATFTVRLPLRASERGADVLVHDRAVASQRLVLDTPSETQVARPHGRALPRVVVAEDSDELRQYLAHLLSDEFEVLPVANGQLAYDVIREQRPDVVVTDAMMPVMDGFELVRRLKTDPALATIPVVMLTARAGAEAAADGLDRGADDYLTKPFSPIDLLARARSAHRMKALRDGLVEAQRRAAQAEREETLREARAALAEMGKIASLAEMAAAIAHELNQPLAALSLGAGAMPRWLRADPPDIEAARKTADRIARDAKRASEVVARIRELFDGSSGMKTAVDLNDAIGEAVLLTIERLQATGTSIRTELEPGLPRALGDRVQLQQVVVNLVTNAVEAMTDIVGRPREVRLRTLRDGAKIRVEVSDVGAGVADEDRDRIFDAFHTTKNGGMGIGLSICQTIVERHGGKLVIASHDGPGATFRFSVPAYEP